jgi:uncharacterized protein
MVLTKPRAIFDREAEWADLTRFAADDRPGATLGVVTGRRRQGKTLLLYELARATQGFYFGATEATEADSLRRLGQALAQHTGTLGAIDLPDWATAVDALLALGSRQRTPVVLDEFPFLARARRDLPSILQHALTPGRPERTGSRSRIVLCGSALSFMGGLLAGSAPLRGRAGLELRVGPLGYRDAARFWGITDPNLAARVYAIVGGTPAYRREYVEDDAPSGPGDFNDWVVRAVLNPARPLFREARYLLAEDPDLREPALYHSVLAAVAEGNATRGGIASYIGRKATDLQHPLTVLEDAGLIARERDLLHPGRSIYRITEPLLTFYQAIMRPSWAALERRQGTNVWRRARQRFLSAVVGPQFEALVRCWTEQFAAEATLGGVATEVGRASVADPTTHARYEIDVLALGESHPRSGSRPLLVLGEAKWGETLGPGHLARLERARDLVRASGKVSVAETRLLLASAAGFAPELERKKRPDVILVDLRRMYEGT